jgi:hypothetical protein
MGCEEVFQMRFQQFFVSLFLVSHFLVSHSALAIYRDGLSIDAVERKGWLGEGIPKLKAKKDFSVKVRSAPTKLFDRDITCQLKKNQVINLALTPGLVRTVSIGVYKAKKDLAVWISTPAAIKQLDVAKGSLVEHLSYGAEGWGQIRFNGKIYEAEVPFVDNNGKSEEYTLVRPEKFETFAFVKCANGNQGWLEYDESSDALREFFTFSRGF